MADGLPSDQCVAYGAPLYPRTAEAWTDRQLLDRFVQKRDEAAFAAIVKLHGPMVLGVCRRVLRHAQDAEDAFQATFLVLARKAGSLEQPERLANWLFGVAYRTAEHARGKAARRSQQEKDVASMAAAKPENPEMGREMCAMLDEELYRMPEKYRAPLVLCYLNGMTNEEAARKLGWPSGSMSSRLARGRQMLRDRLGCRLGLLPGAALPLAMPEAPAPVVVPALLAYSTVQAALTLVGAATAAGGAASPAVTELLGAMLHRQARRRSRVAIATVAAVAALLTGTVAYASGASKLVSSISRAISGSSSGHCAPPQFGASDVPSADAAGGCAQSGSSK
jgi:RNA polymerase sigma factor (sigma-70 family)